MPQTKSINVNDTSGLFNHFLTECQKGRGDPNFIVERRRDLETITGTLQNCKQNFGGFGFYTL
jgi:hypothetical protein